ncbi:YjzD family protein [Bacillus solimangrovi]|uniref:DUF2929 domain-containing protein n=1 Tax=Bacillus solimangrovi TaxID=1305675 RepID=A0A1E5LC22_9BACI|nr:YjzD family protein [Bacillus solimangrovi]OEH91632.1 DUF2929 domain-containing protein [Bacillus solimangrovi]
MRYFWTFFWAFLLSQMITYVVSNMQGASYSFTTGLIFSVILTLTVAILGDGLLTDEA